MMCFAALPPLILPRDWVPYSMSRQYVIPGPGLLQAQWVALQGQRGPLLQEELGQHLLVLLLRAGFVLGGCAPVEPGRCFPYPHTGGHEGHDAGTVMAAGGVGRFGPA